MDCACGHPIFQRADRAIIRYKGETYYVHVGCMGKFFVEHPSGTCVPTRGFLDTISARKAQEKVGERKEEAPPRVEWAQHALDLLLDGKAGEAYASIEGTLPYLEGAMRVDAEGIMKLLKEGNISSASEQLLDMASRGA